MCASVLEIISTFVLTGITIWLTIRLDKKNGELQKSLSNREMKNQTRKLILNIYNAYFEALEVAYETGENVAEIFVSSQSYYTWALHVEKSLRELNGYYYQAKLMVDDDSLLDKLKEAHDSFYSVCKKVKDYINTGIPEQQIASAWLCLKQKYHIQAGNYYILIQNGMWREEFIKLCTNSYTDDIQNSLNNYITLMEYGSIAVHFQKYVQVKPID